MRPEDELHGNDPITHNEKLGEHQLRIAPEAERGFIADSIYFFLSFFKSESKETFVRILCRILPTNHIEWHSEEDHLQRTVFRRKYIEP